MIPFCGVIIASLIDLIPRCGTLKKPASLKILNISVYDIEGYPTILDVQVINKGDRTAFITSVEFHVTKIWIFERMAYLRTVTVSDSYDVELPFRKTPYDTSIRTSLAINGDDVDRFKFKLNTDYSSCKDIFLPEQVESSGTPSLEMTDSLHKRQSRVPVFEVTVKLLYNENKVAEYNKPIMVAIQAPLLFLGFCSYPEELRIKPYKNNIVQLEEIKRRGSYKGEFLITLIDSLPSMKSYLNYLELKYGME